MTIWTTFILLLSVWIFYKTRKKKVESQWSSFTRKFWKLLRKHWQKEGLSMFPCSQRVSSHVMTMLCNQTWNCSIIRNQWHKESVTTALSLIFLNLAKCYSLPATSWSKRRPKHQTVTEKPLICWTLQTYCRLCSRWPVSRTNLNSTFGISHHLKK